ncbi:MAG: type II toxin-antitoxin system RelB/DinJ family antitoxin [archaeon]|nr:type II toxin-antitoxin system RelB/DinJ family antitoxin [archaeon]
MSQATFSIRMDEDLKSEFDSLCDSFGMSMTTAINVFARAVVRERRIPFEITAEPIARTAAIENYHKMRDIGISCFEKEPTPDDINAEINAARN